MLASIPRLNSLLNRPELEPLLRTPLPRGSRLYLVGGFIRDFILKRKSFDIDIAVDGDFDEVIERFKRRIPGRLIIYRQFQTASIESTSYRFDFARTRKEIYQKPAALPEVAPAPIGDDLRRRDFTINAMAVTLKPKPGKFIDPCGGYQDLKDHKIRVLHDDSVQDDPTRIFRAYRYARRFSFAIDRKTRRLIREGIRFVQHLSAERIINELDMIGQEPRWLEIIRDLKHCGVLSLIFDRPLIRRAKLTRDRRLLLLAHLNVRLLEDAPLKIGILKSAKEVKRIEKVTSDLKKAKSRSRAYKILSRLEPSTIDMMRMLFPETKTMIRNFQKDQKLKPLISGVDLISMGYKPSSNFKKILDRIRTLQIDRRLKDREEAEQLVRQWISS